MPEILLRDLIELPDQVTRGDFVYALSAGVNDAAGTVRDYVVAPRLVEHFDEALTFIKGGLDTAKSRGTYLHGSFGSGKSHFMGVLKLLLQGNIAARSIPELAGVVTKHDPWLGGKKFLMVPYHMIGAESLEKAILGGYVQHLRELHPEAPTPAVFRGQEIVANADSLAAQLGEEKFLAELNKRKGLQTSSGWGALAAGWTRASYDAATFAGPTSEEYRRLVSDLIDVFFPSIRKEGEYVRIDEGLSIISQHAKSLGYDALILFLDEMILWLASKAGDHQFLTSEVPKISKLVEAENSRRPAPIISFIARQRDLRELIGQNVTGSQSLNFADQLKYWEGRFNTIHLEDANLPFIAEKRVLRAKTGTAAKAQIDAEFERTKNIRQDVMNVLLTSHSDQKSFRKLYPFSPALVETLVAVSSLLQRERTALKIMLQLLVDQRDTLRLGELVPVGDLYHEIAQGDEAFSSDMKRHFDTAHRLYRQQLQPMLETDHGLTFEAAAALSYRDPKREALRNDDRLIKTLLLAALAPEVEALKNLTPARLAALNHGTIKSPIPGQEAAIVLNKLRKWAGHLGQIKISEGTAQPIVSIQLSGVDVDAILAKADTQDNFGNRIRLLKRTLFDLLGVSVSDDLWIEHRFRWRGTERRCKLFFQNAWEAEDGTLEENSDEWKILLDYPIDRENRGPKDDIARLQKYRHERPGTRTVVWLPSILSSQAQRDLGQLVRLEHILSENRFADYVRDLSAVDRESARSILTNKRDALRQRLITYLGVAYGLQNDPGGVLDGMQTITGDEQFQSLAVDLDLKVPGETQLGRALAALLGQALACQYPEHPKFDDDLRLTRGSVQKVLDVITETLRTKERRLHVEKPDRTVVRQIANPLRLGEMGETHFVMGERWKDHFHRSAAKGAGADKIRVADLRTWMNEPEAMGLPALLQDLVILAFAQQTNRTLTLHGGPFEPELGKLPEDAVLRQMELPEEADWMAAVEMAQAIFGVSGLPSFLSGQSVLRFTELVTAEAAKHRDAAKRLVETLSSRRSDFGSGEGGYTERENAARDALSLLGHIAGRRDAALVTMLAHHAMQCAHSAVGTSLKTASEMSAKVAGCDLTALNSVAALSGPQGEEGRRLREGVFEAFRAHEYAKPFGLTFDHANHAAIQLLASLVGIGKISDDDESPILPKPGKTIKTHSDVLEDELPSWIQPDSVKWLLEETIIRNYGDSAVILKVTVTRNLSVLIRSDGHTTLDAAAGLIRIPKHKLELHLREGFSVER